MGEEGLGETLTYRRTKVEITYDFAETMQQERSEIFSVEREKEYQPRTLYLVKLSFESEGEILSQTKIEETCCQ